MIKFIKILHDRNILLFNFGLLNLIAALVFLLLMQFYFNQETTNFSKPLKFALSIAIFSWTMGWYAFELKDQPSVYIYSWVAVMTLSFEILYISFQAARGQMSHFNTSSPFYFAMTIMMGIVAIILTLWTLYIGILFFTPAVRPLPDYYLWAIRAGIILFALFAMEGGLMGARFSHSVGEPQKGAAIPLLGWNTRIGDLRVAHFIGMHALQVIPLFSWYVFKNKSATLALACIYAILATFTFLQALQGKPFLSDPAKAVTNYNLD